MTDNKCLKLKGHELEYVDFVKPSITEQSEVMIKVMRAGICGTDIHILEGIYPANQGVIMGHECVGEVVGLGSEVTSLRLGELVVVNPHGECRDCFYCFRNCPHFCVKKALDSSLGTRRHGAFAPLTIAPSESCYVLPEGMSLEDAILVEPCSCVMHAIDQASPITQDQDILVMGAGITGLLATILLARRNIRYITVMEVSDHRRETVEKMKFPNVRAVHPNQLNNELEAHKGDPTYGFDRVFDFTGAVPAIQAGFDSMRKKGKLVLFGVVEKDAEAKLHLHDLLLKEVEVTGSLTNPAGLQPALEAIQELSRKKLLDMDFIDAKIFSLSEYKDALVKLKTRELTKVIFDLTK